MILAALIGAGCGAGDASVEAWRAQPVGQPGEPLATVGRLQPAPDLSLPVEPSDEDAVGDPAPPASAADPATESSVFPTTLPRDPETPLTFGWVVPCVVPVVESQEFGESTSMVEYVVRLDADPETNALVMRQTDLRVIDVNGLAPAPAEADAVAAGSRVPDVLVGFDGVETGTRGTAALVDELVTLRVFGDSPLSDEDRKTAISQLDTTATVKYWNTWVGLWAQIGRVPTEPLDLDNVTLDVLESSATRVEMRLTEDLTGAALAAVLGVTVETGGDPTLYDNVRRLKVVEAVTDPATLRPESAKFSFDVSGEIEGEPQSLHEVHAVRFNWPAAQGCGVN